MATKFETSKRETEVIIDELQDLVCRYDDESTNTHHFNVEASKLLNQALTMLLQDFATSYSINDDEFEFSDSDDIDDYELEGEFKVFVEDNEYSEELYAADMIAEDVRRAEVIRRNIAASS